MTESTKIDYVSIVQDLRDEADLCRNETATDIADLLDDAASCIVAMKSQFTALRSELAAAQERAEANARALAEIREEWAGAECGEPVTAQEGYAIMLCRRMYGIAVDAIRKGEA